MAGIVDVEGGQEAIFLIKKKKVLSRLAERI